MFQTVEEMTSLTQFATFKFKQEMDNEQGVSSVKKPYNSESESDECNIDQTMYEKKTFVLMIPHILFWRVQTDPSSDFALQS